MKVEFKKSFAKDLKKRFNERNLLEKIKNIIETVDLTEDINQIPNLKKLKAQGDFYRIRTGSYRIGLIIKKNTVTFVRLLHRSEIYRYFP
ncbi:MAG: type II toxin-antitoxin system RelE/ParE family toxin [Desulfobacteraceae bacterium]|nr:type II toxin-antitoxin system RelE/ParE family toxin [Desulfobacteraceae bacterium]